MKRGFVFPIIFLLVLGCATAGGLQKKSVASAKIEVVEFKPDESGNYYVYVTVRNISGESKPFYMLILAESQPPQITASGARGEPKPVRAGEIYTFSLNTFLKEKPKNISIEIMDQLPR